METLERSFSVMKSHMKPRRLFREDNGVEGCGLFHKKPEKTFHVLGNILRLVFTVVFSPIYLLTPRVVVESVSNYLQAGWLLEYATTPDAVLSNARGGGKGQYDVTGFQPSWVLEVTIQNGGLRHFRQVAFSEDIELAGYSALSYPMRSAAVLFEEAGYVKEPAPEGREYTLEDRQRIAEQYLRLYCSANRREGNPDRTEYIWLDEFCLSDHGLENEGAITLQRRKELGRLADIFRNAAQVAVFCHEVDCDHTGLTCIWGTRLFTIPEILHAQRVLRMTRKQEEKKIITNLIPTSARVFREAMQTKAALGNRWHLYAIFQHSVNSGAVPLVVEAIRRDEAGGFHNHQFLGKALNGLLPRRARLDHLGSSGWNDLAWLLELNQGFYNAASLAAVCSLAGDERVSWLGKPIQPSAGNERLEPIVTAFPVSLSSNRSEKIQPSSEKTRDSEPSPPLTIIGDKTLGLRPNLKRDAAGLYNNEEIRGLKILAYWMAAILVIISLILLGSGTTFGVFLFYITAILYSIVELLASTMYLERDGWVFLYDSEWGNNVPERLAEQDNNLRSMVHWGSRQLVPEWGAPRQRASFRGKLVDLRSRVYVDTIVVARPNAMVPLAIHGSGVTCMLLERPGDLKEPTFAARKVGMCNLPPYMLSQTVKSGTICVGHELSQEAGSPESHR
ncbi:hypothetical protein B0H10DRAFT_1999200 [Mycena sp. CBHHK59/15]|nr:hypothetical protein B0H10DRAFT_1999200 [Mycena sp. CBHHK59/15]